MDRVRALPSPQDDRQAGDGNCFVGELGCRESVGRVEQSDRYHFEVAIAPRANLIDGKAVGDVTVGPDRRVAKVVYEATMHFATETDVVDETLELSGYGTPVIVEPPPVPGR